MNKNTLLFILPLAIYIGGVFVFLLLNPFQSVDTLLHLKAGEVFLQKGLIHYDVFSEAGAKRIWFPYEWLYEIGLFLLQKYVSTSALTILNALLVVLQLTILAFISKRLWSIKIIPLLFLLNAYVIFDYQYFVNRPESITILFFISYISVSLLYILKKQNFLWLTIPIGLLWTNMHASLFMGFGALGLFGGVALVNFAITKEKIWLHKSRVLFLYTLLLILISMTPPLWLDDYRLLWLFYQNHALVTKIVTEWFPLISYLPYFMLYAILLVVFCYLFLQFSFKQRSLFPVTWAIPLFIFCIPGFLSVRNLHYDNVALVILTGWILSRHPISFHTLKTKLLTVLLTLVYLIVCLVALHSLFGTMSTLPSTHFAQFIKNNHLKGNIFNDYSSGDYMLSLLYPEQKVFIDGRNDVYFCCELPAYNTFLSLQNASDNDFALGINQLFHTYSISIVEIPLSPNSVFSRTYMLLKNDPSWILVYWDDAYTIFLKKDHKNTAIINRFGLTDSDPYQQGIPKDIHLSISKYKQMIHIADSTVSENALGNLYLQENQLESAQKHFVTSLQLNPRQPNLYIELATIYTRQRQFEKAKDMYGKALPFFDNKTFIELRLQELSSY